MRRLRAGLAAHATSLLLAVVTVVVLASIGVALRVLASEPDGRRTSLDRVLELAADQRIASVRLLDEDARVIVRIDGQPTPLWASYPKSDSVTAVLIDSLVSAGVRLDVDPQTSKVVVRFVATTVLPLLALATFFALLFSLQRAGSGIGDVTSFGRSGARRLRRDEQPHVGFADVGGAEDSVVELREVCDYLREPARYAALGASPPKGILLYGAPGCGKTLIAKAVAGESGVPFFAVAGAEFVESLVGVGAARIRDLFRRLRDAAPAILFIDEVDAVGRRRGSGELGSDEREQTLNQLLVEIDGFAASSGMVVIAATNRPDLLDPALLRPGRFDRQVMVEPPDVQGRLEILRIHTRTKPVDPSVDLEAVAVRTPGFTGADLANVANEAALLAIREGRATIGDADVEEAVVRVIAGPKRRGRILAPDEKRRRAVHEAGHAVVAHKVFGPDVLHRVSVVARGRSAGLAGVTGEQETALARTKAELDAELTVVLAGMEAERLVMGEPSTLAGEDVERASSIARAIVAEYGMSEEIGPVRVLRSDVDAFLGGSAALEDIAETTRARVDEAVRRIVEDAARSARKIIEQSGRSLDRVIGALEEHETLDGEQLRELVVQRRGRAGTRS